VAPRFLENLGAIPLYHSIRSVFCCMRQRI